MGGQDMTGELHAIIVKLGMKALLEMDRDELATFAGKDGAWLTKRHIMYVLENPNWKEPDQGDRYLELIKKLASAPCTCCAAAAAAG